MADCLVAQMVAQKASMKGDKMAEEMAQKKVVTWAAEKDVEMDVMKVDQKDAWRARTKVAKKDNH